MLCVSVRLETFPEILGFSKQFPEVDVSLGVHPSVEMPQEPTIEELVTLAKDPSVVAVGETGLDYHYHGGDPGWQAQRFRNHIAVARIVKKPLIIHSRDARSDMLRILREESSQEVGGVFHCFTEDWETARAALDLGFYISFSGIVTFKNAKTLRGVASRVPIDRLLIETDCPYLTPFPHRGKPNQPALVVHVAESIAPLHDLNLIEFGEITTKNFSRFLGKKTRTD